MNTNIKQQVLPAFVALALVVTARYVQADDFAPDRFKGGCSDGFAFAGIYRDTSVLAALVRFQGGIADGYDVLKLSELRVPARGTMISIL